jgi:hypothetical protein
MRSAPKVPIGPNRGVLGCKLAVDYESKVHSWLGLNARRPTRNFDVSKVKLAQNKLILAETWVVV